LGHVTARIVENRALKRAAPLGCVALLGCATLLGGCGAVELEGKVFDYMGVSGDRQQADVRMGERAPLMVPPNVSSLPAPSQGTAVATARQDWPDDPEKVRERVIEEKKAKESVAAAEADPINPYAGKETLLDKLFAPKTTVTEAVPDVPEPDASDRVPGTAVAQSRPEPITPHVPQAPLPSRNDEAFNPAAPDGYENVSGGENRNAGF